MTRPLLAAVFLVLAIGISAQEPATAPVPAAKVEAEKPLPPVSELLTAVEKHEDRDDAILQQYTYHSHVVSEEFDGKDSVKKTESTDYESIPINGVRVRRMVAKNGKPLSPDEQKKASEDFDKAVDRARKNKAKYEEKRAQAEREGKANDSFLPASRILELGAFSNERRVQLNGRPTIVLDYAGDPKAKTHNSLEKVVRDLVGTVWIDEQDKVLARVEGHFLNDFKLGLGLLLDIHKGLTFTSEQQKINGEVWLNKSVDGVGKASAGVFIRVHGHVHVDSSEYRKYRASSTIRGTNGVIDENGKPVEEPEEKPEP